MRIIIGLGNIGKEHTHTRHNTGFLALDALRMAWKFEPFMSKSKFFSSISQGVRMNSTYLLVKPETFMNASGASIHALLHFYKKTPDTILVVHDDKDLRLGTWRYTENASSAGQKGVQNIIDTIGTQIFKRIRIGIGPKPENSKTSNFVLSPFQPEELYKLEKLVFPDIISKMDTESFFKPF
jgi:PTH1 family peptidyl-tRNA hydrolase